jgi:virginiamycin B lyase
VWRRSRLLILCRLDPTTGAIAEFAVPTSASAPTGIAAGPDGNLWFTEKNANQLARITTAGVITEYPLPTPSSGPDKVTAGADGNIWFTEHTAGRLATFSLH